MVALPSGNWQVLRPDTMLFNVKKERVEQRTQSKPSEAKGLVGSWAWERKYLLRFDKMQFGRKGVSVSGMWGTHFCSPCPRQPTLCISAIWQELKGSRQRRYGGGPEVCESLEDSLVVHHQKRKWQRCVEQWLCIRVCLCGKSSGLFFFFTFSF